jgi:hypothetical protein
MCVFESRERSFWTMFSDPLLICLERVKQKWIEVEREMRFEFWVYRQLVISP